MDSLKNENKIEPGASESDPPVKSTVRTPNRIPIADAEWQLLDGWLDQVNKASNGFLVLTKSDIVSFLMRNHAKELSTKEISQIRTAYYDPIRHMQWIAPQLKVALETGDDQKVLILQDELKQVEISIVARATRGEPVRSAGATERKNKRKKQDQISIQNFDGIQDLQSEIPEA
jgi:hypothetical protein